MQTKEMAREVVKKCRSNRALGVFTLATAIVRVGKVWKTRVPAVDLPMGAGCE